MDRSRRAGLRVPVDFDVKCEVNGIPVFMGKAVNISTGGIFVRTAEPIEIDVRVGLEFLLPETLNSIQVHGKSMWSRPSKVEDNLWQGTGIKFEDLGETYLNLLREYSLTKLYDDNFVRNEGIVQVLSDIRNLPPSHRLKAYQILIKKSGRHIAGLSQTTKIYARQKA
jgi:Tfp pilus assembly protein PilZ